MATIIQKQSDPAANPLLLEGGKLVVLHPAVSIARMDRLSVDDDTYANLVTAYGPVVGT